MMRACKKKRCEYKKKIHTRKNAATSEIKKLTELLFTFKSF